MVGGITGTNNGVIMRSGVKNGEITATSIAGGITGINSRDSIIENSYARIKVSAQNNLGGLIGSNEGTVEYCYAAGKITGSSSQGGLVGQNNQGTVSSSYYDKEIAGISDTGKGIPKTTSQMKEKSTYSGWDFSSIWQITPSNYPELPLP